MPYPSFNASNVLPPYVGNWPSAHVGFSPYQATIQEVSALGTSAERKSILIGFLQMRSNLRNLGFSIVAQWLDGSFCENIEASEGRPPGDIDVLSILSHTADDATILNIMQNNLNIFDPQQSKIHFKCDHYVENHRYFSVETACYWNSLFSHRRNGLWKGYLQIGDEGQAIDDALIATLTA